MPFDNNARGQVGGGNPWPALHWAAHYGQPERTRQLVSSGAHVNARDGWDRTALHHGARVGNQQVTDQLLQGGADVDAADDYGRTPAHLSARDGHVGVTDQLVRHGADLEARDLYGRTPIQLAVKARILKGECQVNVGDIVRFALRPGRNNHSCGIVELQCQHDPFFYSFFARVFRQWNDLSESQVQALLGPCSKPC